MENKEGMLKYYKLIGQLKDAIDKSSSMEEALREGFRIITNLCGADAAITWYEDKNGDGKLHPYYWIGDLDFTNNSCDKTDNLVGRVSTEEKPEIILQYETGTDKVIDHLFGNNCVSSVICEPLSDQIEDLGCLLFVKTDGSSFTEEQADVCDIFSMFLSMELTENEKFFNAKPRGNILLSARDIKKEFVNGELITKVLKGVNLDIYEGEFVAILGESGCGKTTFLNILGGIDQPTDGVFEFMGKDYSHATQDELTEYRRRNIGFIFQDYNLMPNLNAMQNLDLIGELVDNPMDSEEALKLVGLNEKKKNYPSQLSGGQQQRVSIARALMKRPKLIFADEPTAALDYSTSIEVLSVMENIIKQGTTLLMVTHNEEITRMADRVVRMKNGKTYEITVNKKPAHAEDLVW